MEKTLFAIREYGFITVNIKDKMDELGLSRNALARAINTRFEVVDKWYSGKVEKIDADVLARICFVLECTPGDIIEYRSSDSNDK